MTGILTVDTTSMQEMARQLRVLAARVRVGGPDLGVTPASVAALAAPALVQAVGGFLDQWQAPVTALVADAERLADAVDLLARTYQDAESVAGSGLGR